MTNKEAKKTANVAEQGAHVAPEGAASKKGASKGKKSPTARTNAKGAKLAKKANQPREGSKKAKVLALLGRKDGATLAELMKATGWQAHSVRGLLSGSLGKKMGLKIEGTKQGNGERTYRLE